VAKALYKITLTNWLEHNPGKKNTYKKTLIANNLITDAKVLALPLSHRWLFINLLLICGDYASDTVTLNEQQLNDILTARVGCENALHQLQSLQLVTFEKVLLKKERNKEIKKERKEENTEPKNLVAVTAKNSVETFSFKISFDKQIELPRDLLLSWSDTFPKEFIEEELKKARSWILANPHKTPKSAWGRFFNRWLNQGWERYRTTLKSNPVKVTAEDLEAFMASAS
jgi:hypothetical protein